MVFKSANKATDNLIKWVDKPEWEPLHYQVYSEHLLPVTVTLDIPEDEIPESLGPCWTMLEIFILDDFFASRFGEEGEVNAISDYLKRRGWRESVPGKRYLEALRDSMPSLYEVVELDPGRSMKLRDMIGDGGTIVVQEMMASESLAIWDCLAARVVNVNGTYHLTGSVLPYTREMSRLFLEGVDKAIKNVQREFRKDSRKQRRESGKVPPFSRKMVLSTMPRAKMLSSLWAIETLLESTTPLPELLNSEDEPMQSCEVCFPLRGDMTAAARILDALSMMSRSYEDETTGSGSTMEWDWLAPGDPGYRLSQLHRNIVLSEEITENTEDEIGLTRLGRVVLGPKMLVLKVNSRGRAERGDALLGSHLGDIVGRPMSSYGKHLKTIEDLENARLSREEEFPISPEQLTQTVHAQLDRHYRRVLDDPLPGLGGMTPREAAKGRGKRRREVADWLKGLENAEHRRALQQDHEVHDTSWIWRELGIRKPH